MLSKKVISVILSLTLLLTVALTFGVSGTVSAVGNSLTNPIVTPETGGGGSSADPFVTFKDGYYYFVRVIGLNSIGVVKAKRLQDIALRPMVTVFTAPPGTMYSSEIWAPEIHWLDNKWYIYFTADDGPGMNGNHRMWCIESNTTDAQGGYTLKGKVTDSTDRWAIDGTVFTYNNIKYFVWSGDTAGVDGQQLFIAQMSNPWTISSSRVEISRADYAWENINGKINEGPAVLIKNGVVNIIYSASFSGCDDYCLGMLTYTSGNILSKNSWVKNPTPVFTKAATAYGPGHCSFTKSPDGTEDWIVYHANRVSNSGWGQRSTRTQKFTWNGNSPVFGSPEAFGTVLPEPSGTPAGEGVVSGKYYKLFPKCNYLAIDDPIEGINRDGNQIKQYFSNGNTQQLWQLNLQSDGTYQILNKVSRKSLDITERSIEPGAKLQQWAWHGDKNQRFRLIDQGNGFYKIVNVGSNLCIDVPNASTNEGIVLQQWTDNGTDAQRFKIECVGN